MVGSMVVSKVAQKADLMVAESVVLMAGERAEKWVEHLDGSLVECLVVV